MLVTVITNLYRMHSGRDTCSSSIHSQSPSPWLAVTWLVWRMVDTQSVRLTTIRKLTTCRPAFRRCWAAVTTLLG